MEFSLKVVLCAAVALLTAPIASLGQCVIPTEQDVEEVARNVFIAQGSEAGTTTVDVMDMNFTCLATVSLNMYTSASVVAELTTNFNPNSQIRQFQLICSNGNWVRSVTSFFDEPPAPIATETKFGCYLCEDDASNTPPNYDFLTNCFACDPACNNTGGGFCTDSTAADCCPFFNNQNGSCVDDCTTIDPNFGPDENFVCVCSISCPPGFVANNTNCSCVLTDGCEAAGQPCDNGGTCTSDLSASPPYSCVCPPGVSGPNCTITVSNICELPAKRGNCHASIHRYYFNLDSKKCESFTFGGCNGNENNFWTLKECRQQCESKGEVDCSAVLCPEPTCPNPVPPNPAEGECCSVCPRGSACPVEGQVFQQCKGCPVTCANYGQPNPCPLVCASGCSCPNGQVIDEQSNTCVPPEQCPGTCELYVAVGPCKAYIPRYFYNATSKQCEQFVYGGCSGNENNFETLESCERKCSECAPTCTIDFCKGKLKAKCNIPSNKTRDTPSCFGDCDETICSACYYSTETLPLPTLDEGCPNFCPVDANGEIFGMTCLREWGKCVRSANLDTYGKPSYEIKTADNYKCWRPHCPTFG